jgi:hypothetical protein
MNKTTLEVGKMTYTVEISPSGTVSVKKTGEGWGDYNYIKHGEGTPGENLVTACSEAGMSNSDITVIADRLSVALPDGVAVPGCGF